MDTPTPYPEINLLLEELLGGVQAVLGDRLIGMYLDGSLATGGFDRESDIDFVAVLEASRPGDDPFPALQALHDRLARRETVWKDQLEGFYVSREALRRHTPDIGPVPRIERGPGERLKWTRLEPSWDIHRYVLRERGITLAGPAPASLIDPVRPDQLRAASRAYITGFSSDPNLLLHSRHYQSYTVLSLCRCLFTLRRAEVTSKREAVLWALANLDPRWGGVIERAWEGRQGLDSEASPSDVHETLALIQLASREAGLDGPGE